MMAAVTATDVHGILLCAYHCAGYFVCIILVNMQRNTQLFLGLLNGKTEA